jgi:hypothetical protein
MTHHLNPSDGRTVTVETLDQVEDEDIGVVWTLRLAWVHGIFKTHEELIVACIVTGAGYDLLITPDGQITRFDPANPLHVICSEHTGLVS